MARKEGFTDWIETASTSLLMVHMEAIREGRYPNPSRRKVIEFALQRRVPKGCILVWNEKEA